MQKTNTKKLVKSVITIILSAFLLMFGAHALDVGGDAKTAYADPPATIAACEITPATSINTCTISSGQTCPTGFAPGSTLAAALTCTRISSVTTFAFDAQAKNAMWMLLAIEKALNSLLWPVLTMIGGLMDNSILFENGMEQALREIWIPIRNIVNILFVIGLIGIALYNVLGIGEEGAYSVKAILPKIIVGIIVVNFSFMGIKIFLDAVNILTTSIFTLPTYISESTSTVLNSASAKDQDIIKRFCRLSQGKTVNDPMSSADLLKESDNSFARIVGQKYADKCSPSTTNTIEKDADTAGFKEFFTQNCPQAGISDQFDEELAAKKKTRFCNGLELTADAKAFFDKYKSQNMALAMALNMGNIVFYQDLEPTAKNIETIFINHVVSIMLYVVFAASFITLFVVLLARIAFMWLAIALSPLLLLTIAIPEVKEKIGIGEISTQFVQTAIAPISIGICMTVGWIMLHALQDVNMIKEGSLQFGGGLPVAKLDTLQNLIVTLGTVAVVWMGVFAAASKTIAHVVTDHIKGAVSKVGKFVGTMPLKHAPLVPVTVGGKEDKYTMEQVGAAFERFGETPTSKKYKLDTLMRLDPNDKTSPLQLRLAKDAAGYGGFIKTNSDALQRNPNGEHAKAIKESVDRNDLAYQDYMKENPNSRLKELRELDINNEKNKSKIKDIFKEVAEESRKYKEGAKATSATPKTPPAVPQPKNGPVPPEAKDVTWNGEKIKDKATWEKINTGINPLLGLEINSTPARVNDLKNALTTFSSTLPGKKLKNAEELKVALDANPTAKKDTNGKNLYVEIEKAFGGKDKLDAYLSPPVPATPPAK